MPHSSVLDDWTDSDVPSYKMVYIFDTQNPHQFSDGAVPVVREIGPFTYRYISMVIINYRTQGNFDVKII